MQDLAALILGALLAVAFYWSFYLLPRQREFKKHREYVSTLQPGDEVMTAGGIIGKVVEVAPDEGIAHIAIADDVVVRFSLQSLMPHLTSNESKASPVHSEEDIPPHTKGA